MFKKMYFALISDLIFTFISAYFLCFVYLKFYIKQIAVSLIVSLFFAIFVCIILFLIKNHSLKKSGNKLIRQKDIELLSYSLMLNSKKENFELFSKTMINGEIKKNYLFNKTENSANLFYFNYLPLSEDDIIDAHKLIKNDKLSKIKFFTIKKSNTLDNFINSFENIFEIIEINEIYKLLKDKDLLITPTLNLKNHKLKFNEFISLAVTKKRGKNFILFGIFLLLFSLIVPFSIYYLVYGTILTLLGVIIRFFGRQT